MSSPVTHADLTALEKIFKGYVDNFAAANHAAKIILRGISLVGIGIRPLLDHFVFRTFDPHERVREFRDLGYAKDPAARVFSEKQASVEVYRCKCLPAILIEEARDPVTRDWVATFGDKAPYVIAVRVDDLEEAEMHLERQAVGFIRPSAGKIGDEVREIASFPVFKDGKTVNTLVLVERHAGNLNCYAPDFWVKA